MKLFEHILGETVIRKQDPETEDGLLAASTHDGRELSIRIFHEDISYGRDCFEISLVNTPHIGERQVTSLRFAGGDKATIGYIFPIMSLRTGEYLPVGKWPAIYAAAATRELVETEIAVPHISGNSLDTREFEITDLLPENLGVLVLGRQQLDAALTSIEAVELMLMEYGHMPRSFSFISSAVLSPAPNYESRVSLRPLASNLVGEVHGLKWLLASTSMQQTRPGKFLTLYQIFECTLSQVFGKAMAHMINDSRSKTDPWWVREMVQTIQTETWRLNLIETNCLKVGASHASFAENREACEKLLVALGRRKAEDNNLSWAKALYLVRNTVVHNQTALLKIDESLMDDVCYTLQYVCFDVMSGFTDPSSDFLNSTSIPGNPGTITLLEES